MSMLLWTNEQSDEAIDLGNPFQVYTAFAEMAKAAGPDDAQWAELFSVPGFAEQEVDAEWLHKVAEQAERFTDLHGANVSDHAQWILRALAEGGAPGGETEATECGGEGSGVPGPCPTGAEAHKMATEKSQSILQRAAALPKQAVAAAVSKAHEKYAQLESKYGRKYAVAIVGAAVLGAAIPVPGASLATSSAVVGVAKLHQMIAAKQTESVEAAAPVELTDEEVQRLGKELLADLAGHLAGNAIEECDQGENKGKPGPCPGPGKVDDSVGAKKSAKNPWNMTRDEWEAAGHPVLKASDLENTLQAEQQGIRDFLANFDDPVAIARKGTVEPHPSTYAKSRDEELAKAIGQEPSFRSKTPLVPRLRRAGAPHNGEDARMAIIYGRRLGYQDADIAHYLLNNYIPHGDKILAGAKPSGAVLKDYPELGGKGT